MSARSALLGLLASTLFSTQALAATPCEDCWDDSCKELASYLSRCAETKRTPPKPAPAPAPRPAPAPATPQVSWLQLESSPSGLGIRVDGRFAGTTPVSRFEVTPGSHEIRIEGDSCRELAMDRVWLAAGATERVVLSPPPATAMLEVTADDGSAVFGRIELDGKDVGPAPGPVRVPACARSLAVVAPDGRRWSDSVALRANGTFRIRTNLPSATAKQAPVAAAPTAPAAPANTAQTPESQLQTQCYAQDGSACYTLAGMYSSGDGVAQDKEKAAQFFQHACELEEWSACTDLGVMFDTGDGVDEDKNRAIAIFTRACENGDKRGCAEQERLSPSSSSSNSGSSSSSSGCGSMIPDLDDIFDVDDEHLHLMLGYGRNYSLKEGSLSGWSLSIFGHGDDDDDPALSFRFGRDNVGVLTPADEDADEEPTRSIPQYALDFTSYARIGGVFLLGAGYGISYASMVDSGLDAEADVNLGSGFGFGMNFGAGISLPLPVLHLVLYANYRMISGPRVGGWLLEVQGTFEPANCGN